MADLKDPRTIAVYPDFCHVKRKESIVDGPWFCEDDDGGIAFVSDEMKAAYIKRQRHAMYAYRR